MADFFKLPELKFDYNALEPYIDGKTMEIHLTKHHAAYIANLNKAVENYPELQTKAIENILMDLDNLPQEIKQTLINHGGGHANHSFFRNILTPDSTKSPIGNSANKINETFGNFDSFRQEFGKAATGRFGSGWAWLVLDKENNLKIISTGNQDSPISQGYRPLVGLDVWEHAYYLNYQNRRADYIEAFWNVVDWKEVEKQFNLFLN